MSVELLKRQAIAWRQFSLYIYKEYLNYWDTKSGEFIENCSSEVDKLCVLNNGTVVISIKDHLNVGFYKKHDRYYKERVPGMVTSMCEINNHLVAIAQTCEKNYDKRIPDSTYYVIEGYSLKENRMAFRFRIENAHTDNITCLKSLPGNLLASGSVDTHVNIWDYANNRDVGLNTVLKGHKKYVTCIELLQNNNLVSGSADRAIRVWNLDVMRMESV